jgi:hypothetical protein
MLKKRPDAIHPGLEADLPVPSATTRINGFVRDIMDRRELLGVLGAGAAGLLALRGGPVTPAK